MPVKYIVAGFEDAQVCTRLAESATTIRAKRNDPFTDQISMDPKDIEEKHKISMLVAFHEADVDRVQSKSDVTPLRTVFKDERSCKPGFYVHVPKFNLDIPPARHSPPRSHFKKSRFGKSKTNISNRTVTAALSVSRSLSVTSSASSSLFDSSFAGSVKSTSTTPFQSPTRFINTPPRPPSQMAEDPSLFAALDHFFYGLFSPASSSTDSAPASSAPGFRAIDMNINAHFPEYESTSPYPTWISLPPDAF